MDIRLPDLDGTEAARKLKDGARTARIPVLAMSALPLEGGGDWLKAAGFAGWLAKPIRIRDFPHQVRRYCPEGRS
jgi:CheY-like chemotaxis protein